MHQIQDAKSHENLRKSVIEEQRKVEKLKQLVAKNKAKEMYDILL